MILRALGPGDLAHAATWVRAYYDFDGIPWNSGIEPALKQLLGDSRLGRFFVFEEQEQAVGYAVLSFGFDHETGGRLGVVNDFFFSEASRGQGMGGQAMALLEEFAREEGLTFLELVVLRHNDRARRFYLRNGFQAEEEREWLFKPLSASEA